MSKKILHTFIALAAALILTGGFSMTAYAGGEEYETEEPTPAPEPEETATPSDPLTPEGNATLVDDIWGENKQLITVTTKNGNYFYILIDRAAEGENTVHFLNMVDEADLMALIEDGEKEETTVMPQTCTRILNSKKVTDHHAIIPTAEAVNADKGSLPESEKNILLLLSMKLLSATAQPCRYEAVTASLSCGGVTFTAKGKTVKCEGFKELEHRFRATLKTKPEDGKTVKENPLPELTEGQEITAQAAMTEHDTTPPKAYTEDTLLSAMERAGSGDISEDAERKGLGTPATRAAVLEKLVQAGFVERKKKQLIPTKDGKNLVAVLPDTLTSPKLTAEWENALTEIAKGEADPDSFMRGIEAMAAGLVKEYAAVPEEKKKLFAPERKEVGRCPRCGTPVYEGKKNFYCSNRDCAFSMWKNDRFFTGKKKELTASIAAALLSKGRVSMKGLYSEKTGKTYDADVLLADTGGKYVNYKIELKKTKKPKPKK